MKALAAMPASKLMDEPAEESAGEDTTSADETAQAGAAFDALKDDDREGFIRAFLAAVRACAAAYQEE